MSQKEPQQFDHFINGEWVGSADYTLNTSPADLSDTIGAYATANTNQMQSALDAARSAQPEWAQTGLEARKTVLDFIGNELISRCDEIGRILAREEGKTLAEAVGEVYRSGQFFQYYAAQTLRMMGALTDSVRPGIEVEVRREPVGVVGVITPWNFPMAVASWKVAPALAYGNAVVLKPSEDTPASAWILAEIISRSGVQKGVFNLVMGRGDVVGQALSQSKQVDAVSFTGSVPIGRRIAQNVIANMGKVQLEMGSKNALLVLNDGDLDTAVQCALNGAFFGSGQKCTASSRLIVEQGIYPEFERKLVEAMAQLKVGNPFDKGIHIGSMASQAQFDKVMGYIARGKESGVTLLTGGQAVQASTEGYYIEPTLFGDTDNALFLNQEEIFGPVACLLKADDFDHGLALVNQTEFGLTAGIITQSLARAAQFKQRAQAGCVMVNLPTAGTDYHVPFGGRKASSYGSREQGTHAEEFYTVVKTSYVKPG